MILGCYHMGNPGADVFNLDADDVLSEKRQAEMEELVNAISRFHPTKIAIEVEYNTKADTMYNANYRQYLTGRYSLTRNEAEQIGFRLAKMSGHTQIYCIDESGRFDFNRLKDFATRHGLGDILQENMKM
jgi:hypothetical protein